MLTTIRNAHDQILACCSWLIVDEQGSPDLHGAYVWVDQLECNPGLNTKQCIRRIILKITELVPNANWGYWERRDKPVRKLYCFSRRRLLNWVRRDANVALAL